MFKENNKDVQTVSVDVVLPSLLLTLSSFYSVETLYFSEKRILRVAVKTPEQWLE